MKAIKPSLRSLDYLRNGGTRVLLVTACFIAVWTHNLTNHRWLGLNLVAYDWLTLICCVFVFQLIRTQKIFEQDAMLTMMLCLYAGYFVVPCLLSPNPMRGLTMYLVLLRDLALFFFTMVAVRPSYLSRLNRFVRHSCTIMAAIIIPWYSYYFLKRDIITANTDLWSPTIIYEVSEGSVLRLEGFAGDPNFFASFIAIGFLLTSHELFYKKFKWTTFFSLLANLACLLLTFSRAILFAFFLSYLAMGILYWKGALIRVFIRRKNQIAILTFMAATLIVSAIYLGGGLSNTYFKRFTQSHGGIRTRALSLMSEMIAERPVFGSGLRSTKISSAGTYAHNSWLEILTETGVIGASIWIAFMAFVFMIAYQNLGQKKELLPWFQYLIILVLGCFVYTYHHNPNIWLVCGILAGGSIQDRTEAQTRPELIPNSPLKENPT